MPKIKNRSNNMELRNAGTEHIPFPEFLLSSNFKFWNEDLDTEAAGGCTERHRVKTKPSALCRSVHPLAASVKWLGAGMQLPVTFPQGRAARVSTLSSTFKSASDLYFFPFSP
jgi:hypothetical protein